MISLLSAIVEFLFDTIKGIINFLEELIPLLLKMLFGLSPFVLLVLVAYFVGGQMIATVTGIIILVFIIVGIAWAVRQNLSGTGLSLKVIIYVVAVDILLFSIIFKEVDWYKGLKSEQPTAEQKGGRIETNRGKEEVLLKLLENSINSDNRAETLRAMDELRKMKSQAAIPLVIKVLQRDYPHTDSTVDDYQRISHTCISTLVELNARQSCDLLYEIQIKNAFLSEKAREASAAICSSQN
jgi:hypothetical protein